MADDVLAGSSQRAHIRGDNTIRGDKTIRSDRNETRSGTVKALMEASEL
jgi:hypothetical protein